MNNKEMAAIAGIVIEHFRNHPEELKSDEDTIPAAEAARMLGWNIRSIYNEKSTLGGWNTGRKLYFSRKAIIELVNKKNYTSETTKEKSKPLV